MSDVYTLREMILLALKTEQRDVRAALADGRWAGEAEARGLAGQHRGLERARAVVREQYGRLETLGDDPGDTLPSMRDDT